MSEPALSADDETRTLIDYARRKFAEERWPMSRKQRAVRAIMDKLDPKPEPQPLPELRARVEAELADGEEAEALTPSLMQRSFRRKSLQDEYRQPDTHP